jgi:protein-disulfide isomerase
MRCFFINGIAALAVIALAFAQPVRSADEVFGRVEMNLDNAPILGSPDAPITIVEFDDFQCPICHGFFVTVFGELKRNYIDTGKVRFYHRDLPIDTVHPNAMRAALAGRCANEQGKFWPLHDLMNANPEQLDLPHILAFAQTAGLDPSLLRRCITSGKYTKAIQHDVQEAAKLGAAGTPVFVIGKSTPKGVTGEMLMGARTYAEFDRRLRTLLSATH